MTTLLSYLRHYFILSNYKKVAKKALATCCMGNKSITEYIDAFRKHLVCCADVQEYEAKFSFKNNISDWLSVYILPYNCSTLSETILCAEQIGGM